MTLALILGFLVTATAGAAVVARGRALGAAVLAGGAIGLVVVAVTVGREAVGEATLGALVGLPVLLGGLMTRARRDRTQAGAVETGTGP